MHVDYYSYNHATRALQEMTSYKHDPVKSKCLLRPIAIQSDSPDRKVSLVSTLPRSACHRIAPYPYPAPKFRQNVVTVPANQISDHADIIPVPIPFP